MSNKSEKIKIKKMDSPRLKFDNITIELGEIEEDVWEEPMGPTPKPHVTDLRNWDRKLLERYEPFYTPVCDMCCLCSFGKCDLTHGKRGACGIESKAQQARMIALESCMGTAAHGAHARHMVEHQIERLGKDFKIDMGLNIATEAPIFRVVIGKRPVTLEDLQEGLDYAEQQLQHIVSSLHTGMEGDYKDFESKALHVGMIDNLEKEIGDIAQIIGYDMPKGEADTPLADLGFSTIDKTKPMILIIGHNVAPAAEIMTFADGMDILDNIEVAGICCSAHDMIRTNAKAKVIGPLSDTIRYVRSGLADVVVVDEQCVRVDILPEANSVGSPVIATTDKLALGLPDRTHDDPDQIVEDLVSGKEKGALILSSRKVGEVAVKVAQKLAPKRNKMSRIPKEEEIKLGADLCVECEKCHRACPVNLDIPPAMHAAKEGDNSMLAALRKTCIGCARCESACPRDINVLSLIEAASQKEIAEEKFKVRVGRGPILDTEIRKVGPPIVFGEIPGVVAFAGCSNYANGGEEVAMMAEEFLKRNYIVVVSGCAAMSIGKHRTEDGETLYEAYPGTFDAGGLVNVGSCLSNAHILGAAVKIPAIFARRNLRGNFEEIADYILNRVGAVGVVWGAYSQKALSIGTGLHRWGIPVLLGPTGSKYRRLLMGRKDQKEKWNIWNARTGDKVNVDPTPEQLTYSAESLGEAIVEIARLVMRPNDNVKGRQIKLAHYIDLHQKYLGTIPGDLEYYIRQEGDIPISMKKEILKYLKDKNWEPKIIPDPTTVERLTMANVKKAKQAQEGK